MTSSSHRFGHVQCWKSNICCCFLQAGPVKKMKTNIQNLIWTNWWHAKIKSQWIFIRVINSLFSLKAERLCMNRKNQIKRINRQVEDAKLELNKVHESHLKTSETLKMTENQGNLLKGIDKKTVRFVYSCSLLSNTLFIRKQNGSELQSFLCLIFSKHYLNGNHL